MASRNKCLSFEFNCQVVFTKSTRITQNIKSCIDNVITNVRSFMGDVMETGLSDHSLEIM